MSGSGGARSARYSALRWVLLWVGVALAVRVAAGLASAPLLERALAGGIARDGVVGYGPLATGLLERGELAIDPGKPTASHVPGYPLLLAAAMALGAPQPSTVFALQAALGSLAVGLVFLLGTRLLSRRVGHLAALLAAFFPDLVIYSLLNLSETPHLVLELGAALCLLAALRGGSGRALAGLGVLLGFAIFTREGTVILVMTVAAILLAAPMLASRVTPRPSSRLSWWSPAIVVGIVLAMLVPWWFRNVVVVGEFVPLTTKGMSNLYQGTAIRPYPYTDHRNKGAVLDPVEVERDARVLEREAAARTLRERDRVFLEAAIDNVRRDPAGQLVHLGRKLVWLWSPNIGLRHAGRVGVAPLLLAVALAHFAALGVGLAGLWKLRWNLEVLAVLTLPLVVTTTMYLVIGSAEPRYHFRAWPALLIGAAALLDPLVAGMQRQVRRLAGLHAR